MAEDGNLPRLALLGPLGTYSFQAAYDRFRESVTYCEQRTITDAFNALSVEIPLAVVPQENSIFGSVVETYDQFRLPEVGRDKFVRGEISLTVQHCLLAQRGVKIQEITTILSHEQALGQCRRFIKETIPNALLESTSSTAAAAQLVLSGSAGCAAICSKLCATLFDGLEVLCEGIQDESVNATRFYILATNACHVDIPPSPQKLPRRGLVRIGWYPRASNSTRVAPPATPGFDISRLLFVLGLHVSRVDRRPSLDPVVFHDVYFVELQQEESTDTGREMWEEEVKRAIERVKTFGGEAHLLGIWP